MRILYVEDEEIKRTTVVRFLARHGHDTTGLETAEEALAWLSSNPCDVLIADVRLPGMEGTELLSLVRKAHPDVTVFMVTGYATVDLAVEVMRQGAYDFLTKPFKNEVLLLKLERIAKFKRRTQENWELRHGPGASQDLPGILAHGAAMRGVVELIRAVGPSPSTVLVLGESGTGKERVARALHAQSTRPDGPFVAFNCAALPSELVESELFGHEKGAFTGAAERRLGRFEVARGGTLFLDDVDAMPIAVQAKLLRVIEERTLERVGSTQSVEVDVRLVASARPDLRARVDAGAFRSDLYFRLNVIPIALPPLRERPEDIELLLQYFIEDQRARRSCKIERFSAAAVACLRAYRWPGNVRELRNLVERLAWVSLDPVVDVGGLPAEYVVPPSSDPIAIDVEGVVFRDFVERAERAYFTWALRQTGGNLSQAARLLQIPRSTLHDRLRALRLPVPGSEPSETDGGK
ncbi:MAG TPA: sigma-54 dependent transcriptional regulator [Anaeromyxobacteraceae bacterium]